MAGRKNVACLFCFVYISSEKANVRWVFVRPIETGRFMCVDGLVEAKYLVEEGRFKIPVFNDEVVCCGIGQR